MTGGGEKTIGELEKCKWLKDGYLPDNFLYSKSNCKLIIPTYKLDNPCVS